jgi:hypothetical protein
MLPLEPAAPAAETHSSAVPTFPDFLAASAAEPEPAAESPQEETAAEPDEELARFFKGMS